MERVFESLFGTLVESALRGAALILIALFAMLFLKRRASALRAGVWQAVFMGLALLPVLACLLPPILIPERAIVANSEVKSRQAEPPALREKPIQANARTFKTVSKPESSVEPALPPEKRNSAALSSLTIEAPKTPSIHINWRLIVCAVWGVGLAFFLFRGAFDCFALRRLLKNSVPAPTEIVLESQTIQIQMRCKKRVDLQLAEILAPAVCGMFRPTILLPNEMRMAKPSEREAALRHELAHIQRRDWAFRILSEAICCFYWFLPFVYIASKKLRYETELACDDCVLSTGFNGTAYAEQILEMIKTMKTNRNSTLPITSLTMAQPPIVQSRIEAILEGNKNRSPLNWRTGLALAGTALVLVSGLSLRVLAQHKEGLMPIFGIAQNVDSGEVKPGMPFFPIEAPQRAATSDTGEFTGMKSNLPESRLASNRGGSETKKPFFEGVLWGVVKEGLQAGIRIKGAKTEYESGQRVDLECYLRNTTDGEISCLFSMDPYGDELPTVTNSLWGEGKPQIVGFYFLARASSEIITLRAKEAIALSHSGLVLGDALDSEGQRKTSVDAFPCLKHPIAGDYQLMQSVAYLLISANEVKMQLEKIRTSKIPGQISPIDYLSPNGKHRKGTWAIQGRADSRDSLTTEKVRFSIAPSKKDSASLEGVKWGSVEKGLQTGIRIKGVKKEFSALERIPLECFIQNKTDHDIAFYEAMDVYEKELPHILNSAAYNSVMKVEGVFLTGLPICDFVILKAKETLKLEHSGLVLGKTDGGAADERFNVLEEFPYLEQAEAGNYTLVQPISYKIANAEQVEQNKTELKTRKNLVGSRSVEFIEASGKLQKREIAYTSRWQEMTVLSSGSADFTIVSQSEKDSLAQDKTGAAWGEPWKGVRAGLRFKTTNRNYHAGDPVKYECLLKNFGTKRVTYRGRTQLFEGITYTSPVKQLTEPFAIGRVKVENAGSFIVVTESYGPLFVDEFDLAPGEVSVYPCEFQLGNKYDEPYDFEPYFFKPGAYTVSISTPWNNDRRLENNIHLATGELKFKIVGPSKVERPISWGGKDSKLQIGARLRTSQTTYKVGDFISFEPFVRNLTKETLKASVGNFWKVNYEIEIETASGKPIYQGRGRDNIPMVVAGYRLETFGPGQDYQISEATLRPIHASEKGKYLHETGNEWQERVEMKPGEYRARIVSRGSFDVEKKNPASGWVKFRLE